jgi:demethoxyubiquinone hydroxylase (CLK1/Coq7/Cat5 family)
MFDKNSFIRTPLQNGDIKLRGRDLSSAEARKIRKGLRIIHSLELMAINIYKFQLTKKSSELNRQLVAAMCNEMTHYQDFQTKLYEYGWKPSKRQWIYWIMGFIFGFGSRLLGEEATLKVGIWVETKAARHYTELLKTVDWDEDTRKVLEKDLADEKRHVAQWQNDLFHHRQDLLL